MTNNQVRINEVGLRDGLQSQPKHFSVEQRVRLAEALIASGIKKPGDRQLCIAACRPANGQHRPGGGCAGESF